MNFGIIILKIYMKFGISVFFRSVEKPLVIK